MGAAEKLERDDAFNEAELQDSFEKRMTGRRDSLRNVILGFVSKDKYDLAVRELRFYQQMMSDLTPFIDRTSRYFDHSEELILAIKAKKSFPNIDAMPMGKRQELFERVQEHFDALQSVMSSIERVEADLRIQDARSTVWVVQSMIFSATIIIVFAVLNEAFRTMGLTFDVVADDILSTFFKILGI
jgi:hypothetical protein